MRYENWKFLEGTTSKGVSVFLRPLTLSDVALIGKWRNDEEIRQLLNVDYPVSSAQIESWITDAMARNPEHVSLAICNGDGLIGTTGIHDISLRHRHGTLGIYIGEKKLRGQGIGSVVYELLLKYTFRELNLRVISADVYGHNEASKQLHECMGFRRVGCIPGWQYRDSEYQDLLTYCISKEEWVARQK